MINTSDIVRRMYFLLSKFSLTSLIIAYNGSAIHGSIFHADIIAPLGRGGYIVSNPLLFSP